MRKPAKPMVNLVPSPSDHEFNERIAGIIKAYWQEKGQKIEIRSEGLGVRSRSLNGFPISAQQAKRIRMDGWS